MCGSSFFQSGTGWINVDFGVDTSRPEWQNAEYLNFDITKTWPLVHSYANCIFASHIFEHIEYGKQRFVYEECFRVLKHGSPIRIICPDPRKFFDNWILNNIEFIKECYGKENVDLYGYESNRSMAFSDMFFPDHYDHAIISSISMSKMFLMRAGFSKIKEMNYGNTDFKELFGEGEKMIDNRPVMSWYLEAIK